MRVRAKVVSAALGVLILAGGGLGYAAYFHEPGADMAYDTSVREPALAAKRTKVLFDHAHHNVHAAWGRYKPFANLLTSDGCRVSTSFGAVTADSLKGTDIFVCVNALGPKEEKTRSAFTQAECDAIERWVDGGGSLLLVADHHPCGPSAAGLAAKFGVVMFGGWTDDEVNAREGSGDPGQIVFSRSKGSLGEHPITRGSNEAERVNTVETFTGQSLSVPAGAVVLLPLAESAMDRLPIGSSSVTKGSTTTTTFQTDDRSAAGHCQGVALRHGKGRVVVLAEAAMLSAQEEKGHKFGMNAPGNDNRLFTLNLVRWLAGELGE